MPYTSPKNTLSSVLAPFIGPEITSSLTYGNFLEGSTARQLFKLGDVAFHGFEAQAPLHIMQAQRLVIHEYIGGGRAIQTLGPQPGTVRWGGLLVPQYGFRNAQDQQTYIPQFDPVFRAAQIEDMCTRGTVVPLVYDRMQWKVVVEEFDWDIRNNNEVGYQISLAVLERLDIPIEKTRTEVLSPQLLRLTELTTFLGQLIVEKILSEAEILLILSKQQKEAIESGQVSVAALGAAVITNSIFPSLALISTANEAARVATLIEVTVVDPLEELL